MEITRASQMSKNIPGLSKDITELVTNKFTHEEFLKYAEGAEHSPDFWFRRLRKDFAPLFAKNASELKEARDFLEITLVKEMRVELQKSDKEVY